MQKEKIADVKRGNVYYVTFDFSYLGKHMTGKKIRPCVIVSNRFANKSSPNVTVVPLSVHTKGDFPTHVKIKVDGKECYAMCEQVLTIGKEFLDRYLWRLNDFEMNEINNALKIQFEMVERW